MDTKGKSTKIFDWNKAARILRERNAKDASAGLREDWEWTCDEILRDGKIVNTEDPYLASTWATPSLEIDGDTIDCFIMESESPGWDENTVWPESAVKIFNAIKE